MDLQGLFRLLEPKRDPRLLVGIETMDDAAIYRLTDTVAAVLTADYITPVTEDPYEYGQVAAANSLSDVYAMGGRPVAVLNLCNFPGSGVPIEVLGRILKGGLDKTEEAGAVLAGGHTVRDEEMKYGLSVMGVVHPDRYTPNAGARPGDRLILTKPIGTGVHITGSRKGVVPPEKFKPVVERMAALNKTACEVMMEHGTRSCTDITGFGLGGHALGMAKGSKAGLRFFFDAIPKYPDTLSLIGMGVQTGVTATNAKLTADSIRFRDGFNDAEKMFFADPQTSGGLLICAPADRAEKMLKDLLAKGVTDSRLVGEVFATSEPGLEVVRRG